jgi:hypothetical protein
MDDVDAVNHDAVTVRMVGLGHAFTVSAVVF